MHQEDKKRGQKCIVQPGMLKEQCCLEQKYKGKKMVKCRASEMGERRSWKYSVVLVSRGTGKRRAVRGVCEAGLADQ